MDDAALRIHLRYDNLELSLVSSPLTDMKSALALFGSRRTRQIHLRYHDSEMPPRVFTMKDLKSAFGFVWLLKDLVCFVCRSRSWSETISPHTCFSG